MALLAVFDNDVEVTARNGAVVLLRKGVAFQQLAAHEVDEVHLHGGADLTTAGRNFLLAKGIDVVFLTLDGRSRGRLVGEESAWAARRVAQYRAVIDAPARLMLAKSFVSGKLENQLDMLISRQRWLRHDAIADGLYLLRSLRDRVTNAPDLDALRGVEGHCAHVYFSLFSLLITNPAFAWNGRNRRPPRDPMNAALSFAYTMLASRVEHAVRRAGLDPYLGFLHETGRGAPALALDLMEEFRPMVDGLVLNLVNRKQLGPEDFGPPAVDAFADHDPLEEMQFDDAVHLSEVGRKILTRAWALRTAERSPHPIEGNDWGINALFVEQAHQVRRVVEGETTAYRPARIGHW